MVRVHADLRRQVERDRKPRLTFAKQIAITLVRFGGRAEAGVLAHRPEAAAIHRGINAAGVRKFAGIAKRFVRTPIAERFLGIQALDGKAGKRGESRFVFGGGARFSLVIGHAKTRSGAGEEWPAARPSPEDYNWRERRKELTAKRTKIPATAIASAMSQWATSRFHARNAELSQPMASTANIAPITS